RAFDYFFLASDLLPRNTQACIEILSGLKQSQDVFVRARFLRRLLELEPQNDTVMLALAEIYAKLHVRLDEAWRLAEKLVQLKPSAAGYRLQGDVALKRGEAEKAKEVFERGLLRFPDDSGLKEALSSLKENPPTQTSLPR